MVFGDVDYTFTLTYQFCALILSSYIYINIPFKFQYLFLIKSHLQSYPCPNNINYLWNIGFLLGISIVIQLITGILLSLHYTPHIHYSYYSIMYIIREVYYGWSLRYIHSNGASFLFIVLFILVIIFVDIKLDINDIQVSIMHSYYKIKKIILISRYSWIKYMIS